jgi:NAD+ synthetase
MKIVGLQLDSTVGNITDNLNNIRMHMQGINSEDCDLLLLPEFCLTGYPLNDYLFQRDFKAALERGISDIKALSKEYPSVAMVISYPKPKTRSGTYLKYSNHLDVIQNGECIFSQSKVCLPSYDVFNDKRYFETEPDSLRAFEYKGTRLGFLICEDLWAHSSVADDSYDRDPVGELSQLNLDITLCVLASPYRHHIDDTRVELAKEQGKRIGSSMMVINQVGANDDLIFDGSSFVLDKNGCLIKRAPSFSVGNVTWDVSNSDGLRAEHGVDELTATEGLSKFNKIYDALSLGIKDYCRKTGLSKVVLGVSGGIDSAVVLVLAVNALGADNVHALLMPTKFNSDISLEDATSLCESNGVSYTILPIQSLFSNSLELLAPIFQETDWDHSEENIQSRLRGMLVMAYANKHNALALATGNKSELAMGYATLYGDMNGGLNVIGDIFKVEVYDLAKWMNTQLNCIPERIITRPPSAELRENQTDQDSLPEYEVLDSILAHHILHGMTTEEIISSGYDNEVVNWVVKRLVLNEHKRFQSAPILKVSNRSFGRGRLMPIAAHFGVD